MTTQLLLSLCDRAEAVLIAAQVQLQIHLETLGKYASLLAESQGLVRSLPEAQSEWRLLVLGRSPRDIVWILELLSQNQVSFDRLYAVMPQFGTSDLATVGRVIESLGGPLSNN